MDMLHGFAEFFDWQERQDDRFKLVGGQPLRLRREQNLHGEIVINVIMVLKTRLRDQSCRVFSGAGALRTLSGNIRRADVGVDCGQCDPDGYLAASPRLVVEVLSPSTRDLATIVKLHDYKTVPSLDYILFVEPNAPSVRVWSRDDAREWLEGELTGIEASIDLPSLSASLPLRAIYEDVEFVGKPRLA